MPQVSAGLKWLLHLDILNTSHVIPPIFNTKFSEEQLAKAAQISNNAHYSHKIPSMGPGGSELFHHDPKGNFPDKSKLIQIRPEEYQHLWDKVKNSFYYNLYYLGKFNEGKLEEANQYENSSKFDSNPPSAEIVAYVNNLIATRNPIVGEYKLLIQATNDVLASQAGKDLIKDYRGEFRKGHKGQGIWNDQGENKDHWYRVEFAEMVQKHIQEQGLESKLGKDKLDYLLYITNVVWR